MKKILLLILTLSFSIFLKAQTQIASGNVSGVWSLANSPYVIDGDITIPLGSNLTIEPGVEISTSGSFNIYCEGTIIAQGTEMDSITFTVQHGIQFNNNLSPDSSKFSYCKFLNSNNSNGGWFWIKQSNKILIENSLFDSNRAVRKGGAIYCEGSDIIIRNNEFANNYNSGTSSSSESYGAAIYVTSCSPLIDGNYFHNNSSKKRGGALYFDNSSARIINNVISFNTALNDGGGIYLYKTSCLLKNNIIKRNRTSDNGGGIFAGYSQDTLLNNLISDNDAAYGGGNGGGIFITYSSATNPCAPYIANCLINNNESHYAGGGIYINTGFLSLINCTVVNNCASVSSTAGAGLYIRRAESPSIIKNCIIRGNRLWNSITEQIGVYQSTPNFYNCNVQNGVTKYGGEVIDCIDEDADFKNPSIYVGNHDGYNAPLLDSWTFEDAYEAWTLQISSPCIDKGELNTNISHIPLDLASKGRIFNSIIDIGAYEIQCVKIGKSAKPQGEIQFCVNPENSNYTIEETDGATSYIWSLYPNEAGTITGTGVSATVDWSDNFVGEAQIKVTGQNDCGLGLTSDALYILISDENPIMEITTQKELFQGSTVRLDATTENTVSYLWSTGETTPIIDVNATGLYNVTVTNGCGIDNSTINVFNSDFSDNWIGQASGTNSHLNKITFFDEQTGWIAGDNGTILHTIDGGDNWVSQNSNVTDDLTDLFFISNQKGWCISDHKILSTTDGGDNWTITTANGITLNGVQFVDENNGWLWGYLWSGTYYTFLRTTDGGQNWTFIEGDPNSGSGYGCGGGLCLHTIIDVQFIDANIGYRINAYTSEVEHEEFELIEYEDYELLKTTDGGRNWQSINQLERAVFSNKFTGASIDFLDENDGYISCMNKIYTTLDGGVSKQETSSTGKDIYAISNADVWSLTSQNEIKYTINNFEQENIQVKTEGLLNSLFFPSVDKGWAVGNNGLIICTKTNPKFCPEKPIKPSGNTRLCLNSENSQYTIDELEGATSYSWSISPAEAGAISGTTITGIVDWSDTFTGEAQISVSGENINGQGLKSEILTVIIGDVPNQAGMPTGESQLCINSENTIYTTSETEGVTSYTWTISPIEAGTISGDATTATVDWSDSFVGEVLISVNGQNECGQGLTSESLSVTIGNIPEQALMPTGENQLCINSENTDYISTGAEGASSYTWTISPTEAGTISGEGTTATIDWSDTFVGEALISVSGQNECGQGLTSESLSVTIGNVPEQALMPTGETQLCIDPVNTDYTTTNAEGATSYIWTISPTEAGTISGDGTTATVDWSDTFTGEALISVSGQNECGQGLTSESLSVTISSCTGIETTEFYNIKIFPNPSNGIINIQSERNEQLQIEIINICGQLFYSAKIQNTKQIELESGIYLIRLSSSEFSTSKQVIINK